MSLRARRVYNGKPYQLYDSNLPFKSAAVTVAKAKRRDGYAARVHQDPETKKWAVYVRRRRSRW